MNIIEFTNIVKTYDMGGAEEVQALRGVTLTNLPGVARTCMTAANVGNEV